ncbi:MAG TPA: YqaJ viral recombinase family protein [Streptomyces sp.]|nr:YqaJ viral recombinase family protein [Streptomyces sp.]
MTATVQAGAQAPAVPATIIGWFDPGTPEWHAARANGVGGSEIAAVLGISPYESPFSLWHRKRGNVGPVEETEETYWGKAHEPAICNRFAELHPELTVVPSPTYAATGRPWHIVNPDRLAITADGEVEVVEAKTARDDIGWGTEGTDEIPVHYKAQVRWYCAALAARRAHVAVLIAGSEYREYVVEPDPADEVLMLDRAKAFLDSLTAGTPPPIDGHTATLAAVRELPEGQDDIDVEIPTLLRDRFHAAQDEFWAAEDELTACKSLLLDAIGTGRRAVCERERIATRTVRDGRTYQLLPARTRRNR